MRNNWSNEIENPNGCIKSFKLEYDWLSNMCITPIHIFGENYNSVEHAYQSRKSDDIVWRNKCKHNSGYSSYMIKTESKYCKLIENWELFRVDFMRQCLEVKFSDPTLRQYLLATNEKTLIEGNTWGDGFWGVNSETFIGKNTLGILLMELRTKLRNEKIIDKKLTLYGDMDELSDIMRCLETKEDYQKLLSIEVEKIGFIISKYNTMLPKTFDKSTIIVSENKQLCIWAESIEILQKNTDDINQKLLYVARHSK